MLTDISITDVQKMRKKKELSCYDLITECYSRIEKYSQKLNAFITVIPKAEALAQAKKTDNDTTSQDLPLSGIPFVMKDAYLTEGIRTTAASKILDDFIPTYSATVYERLKKAGAILIGKMNMDAWGHGASTENTDYGPCKNPWNAQLSAGGSGGGPAVAIASRFCHFGIGEDTGGSIRNPAAWNNITALKVTYGRVSRYGAIAYASSLDSMGPTAKTARDCAVVLQHIAGIDPYDATSSAAVVPDYLRNLSPTIKGKKIAFPVNYFETGLDEQIKKAILEARNVFQSLGAEISEVEIPLLEYGVPVYYILAPSETSSNLARFDGVRFGSTRDKFTRESMRRIMTGTYALSSGYYDAYYKKAQRVRSIFRNDYTNLLKKYDAILSPVTPMMPTKIGSLLEDPVKNMMADIYTVIVNIVGVPSLALPCGFSKDGLPIGMQLIGNMFGEDNLLELGAAYQNVTDWHQKAPVLG